MVTSGMGGGGCNLGGKCGTDVRAFEKTNPFIYLIVQNVDPFIYCPLTFIPIYCWLLDKYHSQFIEYQENKHPWQISERQNIRIYKDVRKVGPFTYKSRNNRVCHILFVQKRGPIIYLTGLKRGAIRHAHPYYVIYRKLPFRSRGGHYENTPIQI